LKYNTQEHTYEKKEIYITSPNILARYMKTDKPGITKIDKCYCIVER
jgi:hypothetical protein